MEDGKMKEIWGNVKTGAKSAAKFTAEKTSELAEITKLKYAIHSAKSKLEKCYTELGRLDYDKSKTGDDHADEVCTLIMQIDKHLDDISKLTAEIEEVKAKKAEAEETEE